MAISKILDFSAGSKFAVKLRQTISNDWESQNCDWFFFSFTPLLNLADSLVTGLKFEYMFLSNQFEFHDSNLTASIQIKFFISAVLRKLW